MLLYKNANADYELCDEVVIRDLLPFQERPSVIALNKKSKKFAIVVSCCLCDGDNGIYSNFKQNVIVEMRLWEKAKKIEVIDEGYPLIIRNGGAFEFEGVQEEAKYHEENEYLDNMQLYSLVQLNKQPRNYFARLIQHSPSAGFMPTSEVYILHLSKRQSKHYFIILKHYTLMF